MGILAPLALWLHQTGAGWLAEHPIVGLLMLLMVLDVASGVIAAVVTRRLSSSASWRGMAKKGLTFILIGTAVGIEPFAAGVPVVTLTAGFYCFTEGLSILENAAEAGLPVPDALRQVLEKFGETRRAQPAVEVRVHAPDAEVRVTPRAPANASGIVAGGADDDAGGPELD